MAEKIFLMLNGIGLVFLIFVFVEFLKEGRKERLVGVRSSLSARRRASRADVVIAVLPPAHEIARLRKRGVVHFQAAKDRLSESRLDGKSFELDDTSSWKEYGGR